ncbi:MAG: phosphoglycerate dehydrogenase [Chitinophagaceae bacterium]|nr:phosphoglycerate dehydrogenase [Rubrivivax sp.]
MDVLVVEPLDADVLHWLGARHGVRYAPELAQEPLAFRAELARVRALIIPPSVAIDTAALQRAPLLRVVGRLSVGAENIDIEACARAGIEVVRPASASAVAEAEFVIGALLQLLRRVPIISEEGLLVGRELGGSTVGVVGMVPASRPLAQLLQAFGAKVLGYDPGVHASDPSWARADVKPVGLRELMHSSDAVCVLLSYYPRFAGLFGERLLGECKPNQILVSLGHSRLFHEVALAGALTSGQMAAAWLDSVEPGLLDAGRPLRHIDTLQVTPRVAATTRESRVRSAWAVARRIDELLASEPVRGEFRPTAPDAFAGSAADLPPA